jgi:hypothetical protein
MKAKESGERVVKVASIFLKKKPNEAKLALSNSIDETRNH